MNKLTKSIKPRIAHLNGEQKIQSLTLSYGAQTLIVDHPLKKNKDRIRNEKKTTQIKWLS